MAGQDVAIYAQGDEGDVAMGGDVEAARRHRSMQRAHVAGAGGSV